MKAKWLSDARKIPDEVMNYLRRLAVRAVEEKHYSPELIADIFGMSRSSMYDELRGYHDSREEALDTQSAPGAPPVITPNMDHGRGKPCCIRCRWIMATIPYYRLVRFSWNYSTSTTGLGWRSTRWGCICTRCA